MSSLSVTANVRSYDTGPYHFTRMLNLFQGTITLKHFDAETSAAAMSASYENLSIKTSTLSSQPPNKWFNCFSLLVRITRTTTSPLASLIITRIAFALS